jgi:hypothetical protein
MKIRMFRCLFALGAVQERKLVNGLHVIVKEGHCATTAVHIAGHVVGSGEN